MKRIACLTISILLLVSVSLACATHKIRREDTASKPAPQKTIAATILDPDFQAFLKNHDASQTAVTTHQEKQV